MILSPKESGKFIAKHSININIRPEGIKKLGQTLLSELKEGRLVADNFSQTDVHPKAEDSYALDWIFVVDTLNFCFWSQEGEESWIVENYTGYYALCAAINRALTEKIDILNPEFYSKITEQQLKNILRSDNKVQVPLLTERVKCLNEVGGVLLKQFEGSFINVVKLCANSATNLLNLIITYFNCFKDEAIFKGQKVAFYKRAQILIGDIWACYQGKKWGYFKDLDQITMFADYRVPQTLLWYGVFEYSNYLQDKLKVLMQNGDPEEQEIRGCSIQAVELLKEYVNANGNGVKVNSILIDHFLWDFRRKHAEEIEKMQLPFHKVRCIYY